MSTLVSVLSVCPLSVFRSSHYCAWGRAIQRPRTRSAAARHLPERCEHYPERLPTRSCHEWESLLSNFSSPTEYLNKSFFSPRSVQRYIRVCATASSCTELHALAAESWTSLRDSELRPVELQRQSVTYDTTLLIFIISRHAHEYSCVSCLSQLVWRVLLFQKSWCSRSFFVSTVFLFQNFRRIADP